MPGASRANRSRDGSVPTVYLHIGTPKSGTTYLQALLWQNRRELRRRGLLYPGWRSEFRGGHHRAALELIRLDDRSQSSGALRAWPALLAQIRRWNGDAIVSHELLSFAGPRAIERIATDLSDRETRVVVTARDLMRVIPSWWQEECRNGRRHTYGALLQSVRTVPPTGPGAWFSRFGDLPGLILRYQEVCRPDRALVVVNGPRGTPVDRLPADFFAALGRSPVGLTHPTDSSYPSLSAPAAELLRRVNSGPLSGMHHDDHQQLIKRPLAHEVMDNLRRTGPRISVPPEHREWVVERSREIVAALVQLGVGVAGDVADLVPEVDDGPFVDPSGISDSVLLDWAMDALVAHVIGDAVGVRSGTGLVDRAGRAVRRGLRG